MTDPESGSPGIEIAATIPPCEWDLSSLITDTKDPRIVQEREALRTATGDFVSKWKMTDDESPVPRTDYIEDPAVLAKALDDYAKLISKIGRYGGKIGYGLHLKRAQGGADEAMLAEARKWEEMVVGLRSETSFFPLRTGKIPADRRGQFLNEESLTDYAHYLNHLWTQSQYALDEDGERSYKEGVLLCKANSRERENAEDPESLVEDEINYILRFKQEDDEQRGRPRIDTARHIEDDIEPKVVDSMIDAVAQRYQLSQRYFALLADVADISDDEITYDKRNTPVGETAAKEYPYGDAVNVIATSLGKLDGDFKNIFLKLVTNKQIDGIPREGKSQSDYTFSQSLDTPTYISLINFDNTLPSVIRLAHEAGGHGITAELMRRAQKERPLNFDSSAATSEAGGVFVETVVFNDMLSQATNEERFALMMARLNLGVNIIFRQVAFYQFEEELHRNFREKGHLEVVEINEMFKKHMAAYMGEAWAKDSEKGWMNMPHFRFEPSFYTYAYPMGYIIADSLYAMVEEYPTNIQKVKNILSAGVSDSPKNIFGREGIDISDPSFWNLGLDQFEQMLTGCESIADELGMRHLDSDESERP